MERPIHHLQAKPAKRQATKVALGRDQAQTAHPVKLMHKAQVTIQEPATVEHPTAIMVVLVMALVGTEQGYEQCRS